MQAAILLYSSRSTITGTPIARHALKKIMASTDKKNIGNNLEDKRDQQPDPEHTAEALQEAEKDISNDQDLALDEDPAADMDEGELARFEGED